MEPSEKNSTVNQQSMIDPNKSNNEDPQMLQSSSASTSTTNATTLCVICSIRNRALALVPCGHFIVCVPCGHGLVVCPNCGTNIKALVRIYD
jgi:hypothetical protein